jgi:probable HAF family extracellular repeat protein
MSFVAFRQATFVAALLFFLIHVGAARADFISLGDLPGGTFFSQAGGVSGDGSIVVGISSSQPSGFGEAFRWTLATGMVGLGDLPGPFVGSQATAISLDGSVIVGRARYSGTVSYQAFRWTEATGMVGLGQSPPGSATLPTGVSGNGSVVVGYRTPSGSRPEAFLWTEAAGFIGLGDLPGGLVSSEGLAISDNGLVLVGRSSSALGQEAFRWTETSGMLGLGDLPGGLFHSIAQGVSRDGSIVVGIADFDPNTGGEAFRWTAPEGMVGLGDLPGGPFRSGATAVSGNGAVIIGGSETARGLEAFVWDEINGMRNLREVLLAQGDDLTGWNLTIAYGVSEDGRAIVGFGTNPAGQTEAFLARIPAPPVIPEPGSLTLLGLGALALVGYAWRRRLSA